MAEHFRLAEWGERNVATEREITAHLAAIESVEAVDLRELEERLAMSDVDE